MKILVNFLGRKGGTALYSYEMTKALVNNGAEVSAVISSKNHMIDEWKKLSLKNLHIIDTYDNKYNFVINTIKFVLFKRFSLKKILKNSDIDIMYIPCFHPWYFFINKMYPEAKKIFTVHDPLPHSGGFFDNKLIWLAQKRDLKRANKIIILSECFRDYMINFYKKRSDEVCVIPHGVFDYYKGVENKLSISYDHDKINFLFFGRIEKYKGLLVLAEAYKNLRKIYNNISLTVVGNGDFTPYNKAFIDLEDFKLVNRWIDDNEVNGFFLGNNIVTVLPYLDATQSGVINIAMINRSLVISTNVGGLKEQIKDKKTGILVEANNPKELERAMEFAIRERDICKGYIDAAANEIKKLSWDNLGKILLDEIKNIK
jgi:glycosyltransferase involved in cell wall biosynthesis